MCTPSASKSSLTLFASPRRAAPQRSFVPTFFCSQPPSMLRKHWTETSFSFLARQEIDSLGSHITHTASHLLLVLLATLVAEGVQTRHYDAVFHSRLARRTHLALIHRSLNKRA